jgi:hypothetical protein
MATIHTSAPAREAIIELVVTRADGTVENLGVVSYWHKNPFKRLAWRVKQFVKGK